MQGGGRSGEKSITATHANQICSYWALLGLILTFSALIVSIHMQFDSMKKNVCYFHGSKAHIKCKITSLQVPHNFLLISNIQDVSSYDCDWCQCCNNSFVGVLYYTKLFTLYFKSIQQWAHGGHCQAIWSQEAVIIKMFKHLYSSSNISSCFRHRIAFHRSCGPHAPENQMFPTRDINCVNLSCYCLRKSELQLTSTLLAYLH